jgi:predicted DNA-binding protein
VRFPKSKKERDGPNYHVRRALERYVEDAWDYLVTEKVTKSMRRTYSTAEVKRRLGMHD